MTEAQLNWILSLCDSIKECAQNLYDEMPRDLTLDDVIGALKHIDVYLWDALGELEDD